MKHTLLYLLAVIVASIFINNVQAQLVPTPLLPDTIPQKPLLPLEPSEINIIADVTMHPDILSGSNEKFYFYRQPLDNIICAVPRDLPKTMGVYKGNYGEKSVKIPNASKIKVGSSRRKVGLNN